MPRHIWARTVGMQFVGNRSTEVRKLLASTHQQTRFLISYLSQAGYHDWDELDWDWQNPHLITWARRAAIVNAGMYAYKESIVAKLKAEGYQVIDTDKTRSQDVAEATLLKESLDSFMLSAYKIYCQNITDSTPLSFEEFKKLESKQDLTTSQQHQLTRAQISHRYGEVEVTPELVERDESGWHPMILLHYYLTVGNQFVADRDASKLAGLTARGSGKGAGSIGIVEKSLDLPSPRQLASPFKPDINKQQLALKVNGLQIINLEQFFKPGAVFSDRSLKDWHNLILQPLIKYQIKELYGVNICEKGGPIAQANKLLKKLDLKLVECRWAGGKKDGHRLYELIDINHEKREEVFAKWLERDLNNAIDPNTCLYLAHLKAFTSGGDTDKILLAIAASGGQYIAPEKPKTCSDYPEDECAWLGAQIQKFLQSRDNIDSWLSFFESASDTFWAATWNYLDKTMGIARLKDLIQAIFARGGDEALVATRVEF
ncbi:MAG: hypothetical protein QNJ54_28465 [Prochloraceae cyanobacterium]|nr:hypothetical protein [Prochloraceae cyanobacterium]